MKDSLELNDVFELDGSDYITLDKIKYADITYYFVNKLKDEETPSKEFFVYKDDLVKGFIEEKNEKMLNVILKIFSDNMNKKIDTIRNSGGEE